MQRSVERVLITHASIAQRVRELAAEITADHAPPTPPGESNERNGRLPANEVTIIPILTGAMIFCADLIRHLPMRMKIGLLTVSSYPGTSVKTRGSMILSEQIANISGRHVLLIDDILDSGGTVRLVRETLQRQEPASLKVCVLLRKPTPGARQTAVDYVGFDIPDEFVVGYGLDYDDYYRNLPDIVTLGISNDER
jgi:hypoxanthine phosphoribosyltransferase